MIDNCTLFAVKGGTVKDPISASDLTNCKPMRKPVTKYTSNGCKIVYEEVGRPTSSYRVEITKKDGMLFTKKIYL